MSPLPWSSFCTSDRNRFSRGFTLQEILLCLLILAILVTLAIPYFRSQQVRTLGEAETQNLRTIQMAKLAWMRDHPGAELPQDVEKAKLMLLPYLPGGWPKSPWRSGQEYGNITNLNAPVTSPVNGDPKYEPSGTGDLKANGFNDLGMAKNVYVLPPNVEGDLVTSRWNSSFSGTTPQGGSPAQETWRLTLEVSPPGAGWVSGSGTFSGSLEVPYSTGPADDTWRFVEWRSDLAGLPQSGRVSGPPSKHGTAFYERVQRTLTVLSQPPGAGILNPAGQSRHTHGTSVSASAQAVENYRFVGWEGDTQGASVESSGTGGSVLRGIVMDRDKTVTARFEQGASLRVRKVVENPGEHVLPDVNYLLRVEGPPQAALPQGIVELGMSGTGGEHVLQGLLPGTYTLSEPRVPLEFRASGPVNATLVAGGSSTLTITNTFSPPGLRLTKSANSPSLAVGLEGMFYLSLTNLGAYPTKALSMTDVFPQGTQPLEPRIVRGTGTVSREQNTVTWSGTLGAGAVTVVEVPYRMTSVGPKTNTVVSGSLRASYTVEGLPSLAELTVRCSPQVAATPQGGGRYTAGSTATASFADKLPDYHFVGWSGDVSSTSSSVAVPMDRDKTVTANFVRVEKTGDASSKPLTQSGTFTVTVSNDSQLASGPLTLRDIVPSGMTVTQVSSSGGQVTRQGNEVTWTGELAAGQRVQVKIGYTMQAEGEHLNTAIVGTGSSSYRVNGIPSGMGVLQVRCLPEEAATPVGSGTYALNSSVSFGFQNKGAEYHFVGWSGDHSGSSPEGSIVMDGDKTVTANFVRVNKTGDSGVKEAEERGEFLIVISNDSELPSGQLEMEDVVPEGIHVVSAVRASGPGWVSWDGQRDVSWSGSLSPGEEAVVVINYELHKVGSFVNTAVLHTGSSSFRVDGQGQRSLTVSCVPEQAAVPVGSGTYAYGQVVSYAFTNKGPEYHFVGWSGDVSSTALTGTLAMTRDYEVTANFVRVQKTGDASSKAVGERGTFTVVISNSSSLRASSLTMSDILPSGLRVIGTVTATRGTVSQSTTSVTWSGSLDPEQQAVVSIPYEVIRQGAHRNVAVVGSGSSWYTVNSGNTTGPYELTVEVQPPGAATPVGSGTYTLNSPAVFSFSNKGPQYGFVGWSGDSSVTTQSGTLVMDADKRVVSNFVEIRKSSALDRYFVGATGTFTVTVRNHADFETPRFRVEDALPSGMSLRDAYDRSWRGSVTRDWSNNRVVWEGTLRGGESLELLIVFRVDQPGTMVNTAWTSLGGSSSYTVSAVASGVTLNVEVRPWQAATGIGGGAYATGTTAVFGWRDKAPQYHFIGWSGDSTVTTQSGTIVMDTNKTVTANFVEVSKSGTSSQGDTLELGESGTFWIQVRNDTSLATGSLEMRDVFPSGLRVDSANVQWGGGSVSFDPSSVTWSGSLGPWGSVGVEVSYTSTGAGSKVNTAVVGSGSSSATVNVLPVQRVLAVECSPGDAAVPVGSGTFALGQTVPFGFRDKSQNAHFLGWTGDFTGTDVSGTTTMDRNKRVVANFVTLEKTGGLDDSDLVIGGTGIFTITVRNFSNLPSGPLTMEDSLPQGLRALSARIITVPHADFFPNVGIVQLNSNRVTWSGSLPPSQFVEIEVPYVCEEVGTKVNTAYVGTAQSQHTVVVNEPPDFYYLQVTANPEDAATVEGSGEYPRGSSAPYSFKDVKPDYTFVGWSGDATGLQTSGSVVMDKSKFITANFARVSKTVSPASLVLGGTGVFRVGIDNSTAVSAPLVMTDAVPQGLEVLTPTITAGSGTVSVSGNNVIWSGTLQQSQAEVSIPFIVRAIGDHVNTAVVGTGSASASVFGVDTPGTRLQIRKNVIASPRSGNFTIRVTGSGGFMRSLKFGPLGGTQDIGAVSSGTYSLEETEYWGNPVITGTGTLFVAPGRVTTGTVTNDYSNNYEVMKSSSQRQVPLGGSVQFTIRIFPLGAATGGYEVVDIVPSHFRVVKVSVQGWDANWNPLTPTVLRSGNHITVRGPAGSRAEVMIDCIAVELGRVTNVAVVNPGGSSGSPVEIVPKVDILKTVSNPRPRELEPIYYVIEVDSRGIPSVFPVVVQENIPEGLTVTNIAMSQGRVRWGTTLDFGTVSGKAFAYVYGYPNRGTGRRTLTNAAVLQSPYSGTASAPIEVQPPSESPTGSYVLPEAKSVIVKEASGSKPSYTEFIDDTPRKNVDLAHYRVLQLEHREEGNQQFKGELSSNSSETKTYKDKEGFHSSTTTRNATSRQFGNASRGWNVVKEKGRYPLEMKIIDGNQLTWEVGFPTSSTSGSIPGFSGSMGASESWSVSRVWSMGNDESGNMSSSYRSSISQPITNNTEGKPTYSTSYSYSAVHKVNSTGTLRWNISGGFSTGGEQELMGTYTFSGTDGTTFTADISTVVASISGGGMHPKDYLSSIGYSLSSDTSKSSKTQSKSEKSYRIFTNPGADGVTWSGEYVDKRVTTLSGEFTTEQLKSKVRSIMTTQETTGRGGAYSVTSEQLSQSSGYYSVEQRYGKYRAELPRPRPGYVWYEVIVRDITEMGVTHSNRVAGGNFDQSSSHYLVDEPVPLIDGADRDLTVTGILVAPPYGEQIGRPVGSRGSGRFYTNVTIKDRIYFELRPRGAPSRVGRAYP